MKSIRFFHVLITAALFAVVVACQQKPKDSADIAKDANDEALEDRKEEKDADFVVNTIAANYCEIQLAQLALNRSEDVKIKDMAKMLEKDHNQVITDLKAYAGKNGISVPLEETTEQRDDINKLAEESDRNKFDEKWCEKLKDNHRKSISNFESRLEKSEDVELQNWIAATLPTLRHHLTMLEENTERVN